MVHVEALERLNEEKKAVAEDIKERCAIAKAGGFDVKALRTLVKLRAMDPADRKTADDILSTYMHAAGMLADNPIWQSIAALAEDGLAREQLVDAMKKLVPIGGEIVVKVGGEPVRIWRDDEGNAHDGPVETPSGKRAKKKPDAATPGDDVVTTFPGRRDPRPTKGQIDDVVARAEERRAARDRKGAPADKE